MSVLGAPFTLATATPHGFCLLWNQQLIALHVLCNGLIAAAYLMIPSIIYLFVRKKRYLEKKILFALFGTFIFACALTHLMNIVVIWYPHYFLQGWVMAFAAVVSWATVMVLWREMPELIKLPSLQLLQEINQKLLVEIEKRSEAEHSLHTLNKTLENRIAEEVKNNRDKDYLILQQSRLAAMGEMIGNIAHQWRQPINALNLVLMNIGDAYQHHELTQELLNKQINKGELLIQAMSTTIDDFRNFFKPETSQEAFEVNQCVRDVISIVEGSCRNHNINVEVIENSVIKILGFPGQYRQALLNIIGNAKDALIERHISPGKITITLSKQHDKAIVSIHDNAGGIDVNILNKVFDPYFTTRAKGNGIGLYMSKLIIENNMLGELKVQNHQEGALFRIETAVLDS